MRLLRYETLQEGQIIPRDCYIFIGRKLEEHNGKEVLNGFKIILTSPFINTATYVSPETFKEEIGSCRKTVILMIRKIANKPPYRWVKNVVNMPV